MCTCMCKSCVSDKGGIRERQGWYLTLKNVGEEWQDGDASWRVTHDVTWRAQGLARHDVTRQCQLSVQRCTSLQHIPTTYVQLLYNCCTTVVQLLYDISTTLQHYNIITVHTLYRVRVRILTSRLLVKLFYISSLQLQPHVWNIITSTPESSSTVFIKRFAV